MIASTGHTGFFVATLLIAMVAATAPWVIFSHRRRLAVALAGALTATGVWRLYESHLVAIAQQVGPIRVDLFVIWPALFIAWLAVVVSLVVVGISETRRIIRQSTKE